MVIASLWAAAAEHASSDAIKDFTAAPRPLSLTCAVCYRLGVKALVLSAGGMFGAWQAGAWVALEGIFQPDLVVGASVGSLNGWMIACGCGASELLSQWRDMSAMMRPLWRRPRTLTDGLVDTSAIESRIRELCANSKPRIRLGIVCVRLKPPGPVLFQNDEISWRHLAASCAVPGIMAPVRIDGKLYVDGGALGPLPLWAAAEMGATRIVAMDVLSPRPLALRIPQGIFRSLSRRNYELPPIVRLMTIGPPKLLGGWTEASHWNAQLTERWIEEGRQAGLAAADKIRELMA
jgi:NTE family protein